MRKDTNQNINSGRLKGKVALIFGGTGDIGGAIALGMAKESATVIPAGRDKERLLKINRKLFNLGNSWNFPVTTDITKVKDIQRICPCILPCRCWPVMLPVQQAMFLFKTEIVYELWRKK